MNVSTKLVQSWEQGLRNPDRGEARLIEILIKQPELVSGLILSNGHPAATTSRREAASPCPEKAPTSSEAC